MDINVYRALFKEATGAVKQCVFQGHESQIFNDTGKTVAERLLDILKNLSSPFDASASYPVGASCFVPGEDRLFKFTSKKEPGPWDDSVVEQVTLTEIISDMEKALTDKINDNASDLSDGLNAKIEARLLSSSAEKPYRDDKTYSVGDVCTKDGKIYCMIQEKLPGNWDDTLVEEITIGRLIRESRASVLNEVKNTLKGFVSGSAIASNEFDEGENYSTGDTVFYESKLYRFIQNKLAGVFDSSMVEEITLEGLLSELETKIKNDISSMPTDCAKMRALAPEFDETKAYSVGDYISKDGLLYKIIKNKPAGTWDDASVEETKVVDLDIGGSSAPISQNVTKIANISTNGKVHDIDFTNFIDGETIIAPATGWMYAETSRGQAGKNAYVNIYVAKDHVDFEDSSSHYYSALNDRVYDIGNTSSLAPVTKGDTVEIYFNQPLTALRIFEVEPIEPKYLTDRTELASLMWSDAVADKIIEVDDLDQYDQVEFELSNNIDGTIAEGVSRYVFNNANLNAFQFDYNLSVTKLAMIRWLFDKIPEGLNIRSRTGYSGDFNGVNIKIYGVKTINVDDLVNPIVTDEKKLLYSGNVTGNGDITVGDMSIYNRINIKAFVENPDGSRRLFEDAELIKESGKHTFISINLNANSVIGFYRVTYINGTTIGISDFVALNVSGLKFYTEIYGYNEVLVNDLINELALKSVDTLLEMTEITATGEIPLSKPISEYDRVELSVYAEFSSGTIYKINTMIMEDDIPASFVYPSLNNSNMIRAFLFNVKLHESQITVISIGHEPVINKVFAKVEGYKFAPQEIINPEDLKPVVETKKVRTLLFDTELLFGGQMGELPVTNETFDYLTVEIWGSQSNDSTFTKIGSATFIDGNQNGAISFNNEEAMLFVNIQFVDNRFAIDSTGRSINSPIIKIYGHRYETTVSFTN